MNPANHDEIVGLLGDVDDLLVERLLETGASLDEIIEAWGDLQDEGRVSEQLAARSPRVAEARAILAEMIDSGDDERDEPTAEYSVYTT